MAAQLSGFWLNSSAASLTGELLHRRCTRSPVSAVSALPSTSSPIIQIVGGKNSGWNGIESSKLSSTLDVDPEEFDWAVLESDIYHWTKVLRPVQWYPGHIAKTEKELEGQLKLMDVVIEVRDARIPMSTSHPQMDAWLGNRKRIVVLNREDMISKVDRNAWASYYARQGTKVVFSNGQFGMGALKLIRLAKETAVDVNIKRKSRGLLPRPWALGGRPLPLNTRTNLHNSRITVPDRPTQQQNHGPFLVHTVPFVCTQPEDRRSVSCSKTGHM